jgi:hypothetical protein
MFAECARNAVNVEFLFDFADSGDLIFGCRLRPYGRRAPKNKMALGGGYTVLEAVCQAIEKAKAQRWETLDWSARPWATESKADDALWFG